MALLSGLFIVLNSLARRACERLGIQPLVGFILAGLALALLDQRLDFVPQPLCSFIDFLGQLGVIILLFKVGLESNITGLMAQFRRALPIWFGNVVVAALFGFGAAFYLLDLGLVPSLFAGTALSATSVGVAAAVWQDAGQLDTDEGELLVDVAELDDISAMVLVALLFSAAPLLLNGQQEQLPALLGTELVLALVKITVFAAGCYLFARHLERRFTAFFHNDGLPSAGIAVATAGLACVIAGGAELIGFSVAIGALFAGLAFSRDPEEFEIDRQLEPLHDLLMPFFFLSIGFNFDFASAGDALAGGSVLLAAGIVGKMLGAGLPALTPLGRRGALRLGVSMVPRAEIAMIIMLQGVRLGEKYVPDELFGAMSVVALSTALLVPLALQGLFEQKTATG